MSILLGNLSLEQIEDRMGVIFPEDLRAHLLKNQQDSADTSKLKSGNWHCFDIPFTMVCGSMGLAQKIYSAMNPFAADIKTALRLSVREKK